MSVHLLVWAYCERSLFPPYMYMYDSIPWTMFELWSYHDDKLWDDQTDYNPWYATPI